MPGEAPTVFLLSPARCSGERAAQLARSKRSELGARLRAGDAPIGDVFAWLSALYFRGKLAYARRFGAGAGGAPGALVMAPGLGLRAPEARLSTPMLCAMGEIEVESEAFVRPLARDARLLDLAIDLAVALPSALPSDLPSDLASDLASKLAFGHASRASTPACGRTARAAARVVLLGSIATGKYLDTLLEIFGERLLFPEAFVGRGDMSRGGLLLRAARSGEELAYRPVLGATLRGTRPPKLPRLRS